MLPIVSILIPVYNAEAYLAATLDSCLEQTFWDFEVIAVDDGSTDRSVHILEQYTRQDERIRVIHQVNQGANVARRTALSCAKGEYVCFLDADDLLVADSLQKLWEKYQRTNDDIIVGSFLYRWGKRGKIFNSTLGGGKDRISLYCSVLSSSGFMPSLWGKLIRTSLLREVNFVDEFSIGEDAVVIFQLMSMTEKISSISDVIYIYIQRKESISHSLSLNSLNSIIKFCLWTSGYFTQKGYLENERFKNSYAEHVLNQYSSFLLEGGSKDDHPSFTQEINIHYLNNTWAVRRISFWRLWLLRAYRLNSGIGFIVRNVLNFCRRLRWWVIY